MSLLSGIADVLKRLGDGINAALYGDVICRHFCLYKQAGSKLRYTHVHILVGNKYAKNKHGYTGLGHDDETNPQDATHNSVSDKDGVRFIPSPGDQTHAVYPSDLNAAMSVTAYFIAAPEGKCPPGFRRRKCECGDCCFTFDHGIWERWYEKQSK